MTHTRLDSVDFTALTAVAISVGRDSNNPDGGLSHETPDDQIVEIICDIGAGNPHKLGDTHNKLSEHQEALLVKAFFDGAYDR